MGKCKFVWVLALLVSTIFLGASAFAGDETTEQNEEVPTCDMSVTFYSQYIWRGFELSKDSLVIFYCEGYR